MTLVQPVIMAGGKGTRLWPLSRPEKPKQFLPLVTSRALVADVAAVISSRADMRPPIVVTGEEYAKVVRAALEGQRIGLTVLEPIGRSTAFVAAVASLLAQEQSADAIVVLLSAEFFVADEAAFNDALDRAITIAEQGDLVLIGAPPMSPSTQFGYIERGDPLGTGYRVSAFKEKPNAEIATRYVGSGRHLWNSGNFVFRADAMRKAFEALTPDILVSAKTALNGARRDGAVLHLDAKAMERCPAASLDRAIMEKTTNAAVVLLDCAWDDLGSWGAVWTLWGRDVVTFVKKLRSFAGGELGGEKADRLWGSYEVLLKGKGYQVKTIEVRPGQAISLQYHHRRAEHWIVTRGRPRITVGSDVRDSSPDETVFVEIGAVHRIENPTGDPVAILEIQIGDYLGEDDIVRLDDRYDRITR